MRTRNGRCRSANGSATPVRCRRGIDAGRQVRCDGRADRSRPILISPPVPPVLLVKSLQLIPVSATKQEFESTTRTGGTGGGINIEVSLLYHSQCAQEMDDADPQTVPRPTYAADEA